MVYPIARWTLQPIIKLWIKDVEGLENLPDRPFVFAANHSSFADDMILPITLAGFLDKKVHIYCNDRFYKSRLLARFLEWGGCIPVRVHDKDLERRKRINEKAFKTAITYLNKNDPVGLFPEGGRSYDGNLLPGKTGIARLALKAGVPVVPIGIIGSHKILPKGKMVPRPRRCVVKIGKPIRFEEHHGKHEHAPTVSEVTRDIMKSIAKLTGKEYLH
jgi:1-acyl-sn-glycerol-3-phosphate acyltransferase